MNYVPDFVVDAMNVYRTRNYIVKQSVGKLKRRVLQIQSFGAYGKGRNREILRNQFNIPSF